jgi:hypothetical protein
VGKRISLNAVDQDLGKVWILAKEAKQVKALSAARHGVVIDPRNDGEPIREQRSSAYGFLKRCTRSPADDHFPTKQRQCKQLFEQFVWNSAGTVSGPSPNYKAGGIAYHRTHRVASLAIIIPETIFHGT